ncbi:MAG: hypothetical protein ACHP7N_19145 [Caulobacterales bacterium]
MTSRLSGAALGLAAALVGQIAAAADPPLRACDVRLNVTDQDPAGLNVRAAPAGAVIGALKAKGAWVQVHVTGQAGEWARIDGATLYDDALADGERPMFKGAGFVAFSKLGIEELKPNAQILAGPSDDARRLLAIPNEDESLLPPALVLGCSGAFLQVRVQGVVGWTRGFCANQRTTCV